MPLAFLAIWAGICLVIALLQSWLIVARLSNLDGAIGRIVPNARELIRSHIDFLMMSQFLFVFYGLYRLMELTPPAWLVAVICFGSFFNPFAFFARALKPDWIENAPRSFTVVLTISCISTTVGYAIVAWSIGAAAFAQASA